MSVKLRLRRMGKKKQPFYRIVATDSRAPRDGRFIELVGTYDPLKQPSKVDLKEERIIYWLKNGAQPSQTVKNLFKRKGLWFKWDLIKNGAAEEKISQEFSQWQLLQEEREKRLANKQEQKKRLKAETKAKVSEEKSEQEVSSATPSDETVQTDLNPEVAEAAGESSEAEKTSAEKGA